MLDARRRWPIDPESTHPVAVAARTGRPQLIPVMTPAHLEEVALAPGHLEHMRGLEYSSGIAVPLVARGRTLGVLAFVRRSGRHPYGQDDLRLAIELARRSATALDNARLFAELRRTERQLEAVLGNLAEAVTVQAPDFSLLYVNQAAAELLECRSPEEVLGRRWPRSSPASPRWTRTAARSTTRACPAGTRCRASCPSPCSCATSPTRRATSAGCSSSPRRCAASTATSRWR